MKKIIALLTVIAIITMSFTVFASDVSDKTKEVLSLVKSRIGSTDEYDDFSSDISEYDGTKEYNFHWYADTKVMNLSVLENGIITGYNAYDFNEDEKSKPTVNKKTTAEMLPYAKELLKKFNPDIYSSLVVSCDNKYEDIRNNGYYYDIQRYENGIPVNYSGGSMAISADGSEILSFYISYDPNLTFPESAVLSKEEAKAAFCENFGMILRYFTKYEDDKEIPYLAYTPCGNYNEYISAVTGEVVAPLYPNYDDEGGYGRNEKYAMVEDSAYGMDFSPAELEEIENLKNVISKEEAEKIARANEIINLSAELELNSINLNRSYGEENEYYYFLNFVNNDKDNYRFANVTLDAVTGKILSFYKDRTYDKEDVLTFEEAINISDNAKAVLLPEIGDEYIINEDSENGNFWYTRYINDIEFPNDSVNISVDTVTGEVVEFNYRYSKLDFPSPEGVITEEQACEKLFDSVDYSLTYIPTCSDKSKKQYDTTLLVYCLDKSVSHEIDAFTGEQIKYYEEEIIPEYTDIAGHYGETAITTLRKFGIGFEEEQFRPDDIMTKRDFTSIALSALSWNDGVIIYRDFDYSDTKIRANEYNIEDADNESPVTREDAAVIMIKILGFDEVASLDGIYNCPFADVTEHKGHISILNGLNVVHGDGSGNFNPKTELTRADGAILIYNYLSR